MYSIKYKHKDASTEYYLYRAGDQEYCLTSGSLSMEMGKAGELKVSLPITNPAIDSFECLTDEIIVLRDNVEIWRGRAVTSQQDFDLTGTLVCEGVLAYLYDTIYPPFEFQGTPASLLNAVINNHNSFVNSDKQFTVGNITVTDRNDYINRSCTDYLRSIEILSDKFVGSSLGGYFRVRVDNGTKYLDYLDSYNSTATQYVEFGENILDLATEIEYGDAITAILPLGVRNEETGEKLTVKSVNGGDIYVRNANLISARGFIAEVVEWEDVTEASNLLTKARNYLAQASTFIQTFTIKAIDLHYADATITAFNLGDSVRVVSEAHGVNQYSELYKASFDLLDPSNDSYEFGITRTNNSLTGKTASSQRTIKDSLSNLTVNFHKIAADYVTTDYLSANYATITNLEATNANITNLQADVAEIDTALINKADVADLTAANAHITDLEADYANIHTLLSGSAGVGDLQTIHLTSQNSVIDVAVIRNLLANNITVNDLMAGDIITNRQRIISNDGSFVIDGSTQTIKDENGNVRIQIGRDANNEFTFVLYDENGTGVLLDADGIHESAIGDGLIKNSMVANNANIQATKLDIASLFTAMNADGSNTLYANKIWFDDQNQTLTQLYTQTTDNITQISSDLSDVEDTADSAYSMAEAATRAADQATRALEGITSLDNLTAILSNDAHVVHTYYDGTGGDYSYAKTQVYAYKGDTDVTARAAISVAAVSGGVAGTWNTTTKTYQVTDMTALNGYVDFEIGYGETTGYLLINTASVSDNGILMPNGKKLKIYVGGAKVYKRFSISKSPDGEAGTNYSLQTSVGVIRRSQDGLTLNPSTITFSARKIVGEVSSTYSGKYKIEETTDWSTWTQKYYSSSVEESKTYTPTVSAKMIRATLMDADGTFLDSQTVTVIADADEMNTALVQAQSAIQTVTNRVGIVETGVNGLSVNLAETNSSLYGMAASNLLFQIPFTLSGSTYTFDAKVYKSGDEVHTDYPRSWFQWFRRTESGTDKLGTGYSVNVAKSTLGYGATIIGRFSTFADAGLLTVYNNHLVMPDGNRLLIYAQPTMQFDCEANVYQDDAILSKFSSLDTQFDVTNGKISALVSDSEITQYNSGSTMSSKLSAVELSLNGLYSQFSETVTDSENGLVSKVTQLEANVDGLSSSVVYTNDYTGETIASLINQSASTVQIQASHVDLEGYVTMTNLQTAGQTTINGGNIRGGTITLGGASNGNGVLKINNASGTQIGKWDKDGLTATNANITGAITATSGSFTGTITAASGSKLGAWTVADSAIWRGNSSYGNASGMYFGTSGLSLGSAFKVTSSGAVTATNLALNGGSITLGSKFSVSSSGVLTATGATISGAITATSGTFTGTINASGGSIGNWSISNSRLQNSSGSVYLDTSGLKLGNVTISSTGAITGSNWSIAADGTANFKKATTFEAATTFTGGMTYTGGSQANAASLDYISCTYLTASTGITTKSININGSSSSLGTLQLNINSRVQVDDGTTTSYGITKTVNGVQFKKGIAVGTSGSGASVDMTTVTISKNVSSYSYADFSYYFEDGVPLGVVGWQIDTSSLGGRTNEVQMLDIYVDGYYVKGTIYNGSSTTFKPIYIDVNVLYA